MEKKKVIDALMKTLNSEKKEIDFIIDDLIHNVEINAGNYANEGQDTYRNRFNKQHRTTFDLKEVKDFNGNIIESDKIDSDYSKIELEYSTFRELISQND